LLKNIKRDKWRHFWVGIAMGAFLQLAGHWLFPYSSLTAFLTALIIVFSISYGFELFSMVSGLGRYDLNDAIASIIGGVLGMTAVTWAHYKFEFLRSFIQAFSKCTAN
jgi:glycopeptide antibiotics resistance protein